MLFTGFSKQEYQRGLPFPSPVTHVLSELPPWPVRLGWPCMTWLIASLSYTRLWSMWWFWLAFSACGFCPGGCGITVLASSVCPLVDEDKRLPDGRDWPWGKVGLALVGRAMLCKTWIELSADGWGCAPSLSAVQPEAAQPLSLQAPWYGWWRPPQEDLCQHTRLPRLWLPAPLSPEQDPAGCTSAGDPQHSWAGLAQSLLGITGGPGAHKFFCALQESLLPSVMWKFCNQTLQICYATLPSLVIKEKINNSKQKKKKI